MNERNVAALLELLVELGWDDGETDLPNIARTLASRGVLVPSAMTDAELADTVRFIDRTRILDLLSQSSHITEEVRRKLDRIAKGEAPTTKAPPKGAIAD